MNRHRIITCFALALHMWFAPLLHAKEVPFQNPPPPPPMESGSECSCEGTLEHERAELAQLRAEVEHEHAVKEAEKWFALKMAWAGIGLAALLAICSVVSNRLSKRPKNYHVL